MGRRRLNTHGEAVASLARIHIKRFLQANAAAAQPVSEAPPARLIVGGGRGVDKACKDKALPAWRGPEPPTPDAFAQALPAPKFGRSRAACRSARRDSTAPSRPDAVFRSFMTIACIGPQDFRARFSRQA
jgi:hypothetical protein